MPKSDSRWMEHADIKKSAFGAKAKRAGVSTAVYAKKEKGAAGKLGKEARLAQTFAKARKKKPMHRTIGEQMLGGRG